MVGAVTTAAEAWVLREKLLARRVRLLDFAAQQVEADPASWGWLRMLADTQLALQALEAVTGKPTP